MKDLQQIRAGKSLVELLRDNDVGCCEECLCDKAADEIERLLEALKPFATVCGDEPWDNNEIVGVSFPVGAFRRARAALKGE